MIDPIRIELPESIRLRLLDLHTEKAELSKQVAAIDRDTKTIVDTLLGTKWAPNDPLWGSAVALDTTHVIVTPPAVPTKVDEAPLATDERVLKLASAEG